MKAGCRFFDDIADRRGKIPQAHRAPSKEMLADVVPLVGHVDGLAWNVEYNFPTRFEQAFKFL